MVRRAAAFVLGLAFLAAAASAVHAIGTPAQEPPWASGFDKGPAYDEPAPPPQNPRTRTLPPTEPIDNQLRPRHLEGSLLTFSLLQTRDAHNVVDWFPGDHPSPMPDIIAHGPKALANGNAFVPIERSRALTEPIGGRIIEVSNDDRNIFEGEPGNPGVGWTADVPQGSVAKGRETVTTGGVMRLGGDVVPSTTTLGELPRAATV